MDQDIKDIMDWFKANKLTLNLDKTECLIFYPSGKTMNIELNLGDVKIQSAETVKFLGM